MTHTVLDAQFFQRPVLDVAPDLLGTYLVRRYVGGEVQRYQITEVEAYDGEKDLANHASKGRTPRTEVMYAAGGIWYVYLVYGMHHMLNIVTGESGYPAAVLIRGVREVSGPGRLTKQLQIDRSFNGLRVEKQTSLWIEQGESRVLKKDIIRTPRIGVAYAKEWASVPYRWVWDEV